MKVFIFSFLLSTALTAQILTVEEQKHLIEENKMLREEIKKLHAKPQDNEKIMDALKKGQKYQEEQNKALEELDKED